MESTAELAREEGFKTMGCLLVLLAALSPRLVLFLYWLARPVQFDAAFGGPIAPLLGIIFLPFTTLMYVLVQTPGIGLVGTDWIWVGLAFAIDISHSVAVATDRRNPYGLRSA
jgi:hypothetical protein